GARVKSCSVRNVGTFGVHVVGDDARVIGNQLVGSADEGVFVEGNDARIEKNDFRAVLDYAVRVDGARAKVRKNEILRNQRTAVRLDGADHVVVDNEIVDVDGYGIDLDGPGARIESNEIAYTYGESISVEGGTCEVIDNELSDALDGYSAIRIGAGSGAVVRDNEIARVSGSAVFVNDNTFGMTITGNVADECGDRSAPTFRIAGTGHLVADNVAKNGGNDGFRVTGMQHVLLGNRAIGNLVDGIDLQSGSLYEVRDNKALRNGGEGIENSANDVLVRDNVAKKNRIDLANNNPVNVTFEENEFETGGKNTQGELE
ncbi:MAG: right-handed parallel beta-helix repeat-containing protein, partial [Planctomycetota bacterium JB042]